MFILVLAHPGSPGQRAVKRLLLLFVKIIIGRVRGMGVHSAGEICYLQLPCL